MVAPTAPTVAALKKSLRVVCIEESPHPVRNRGTLISRYSNPSLSNLGRALPFLDVEFHILTIALEKRGKCVPKGMPRHLLLEAHSIAGTDHSPCLRHFLPALAA